MSATVTKSPLLHLPQALQNEIASKLSEIDQRVMTLGLEERGGVRHWLLIGQKPTEQLTLALRDAPEDEWAGLVRRSRTAGSPIAGSVGAGDRAAHELMHKWRSVIRDVRGMVPEGADLENWCGFVRLANAMMEMNDE